MLLKTEFGTTSMVWKSDPSVSLSVDTNMCGLRWWKLLLAGRMEANREDRSRIHVSVKPNVKKKKVKKKTERKMR